jgi:hypothetical protein
MQTVVVYEDPAYDEPRAFLYKRDIIVDEKAEQGGVIRISAPEEKFPSRFLVREIEFNRTFDTFGLANRIFVRPLSTLL